MVLLGLGIMGFVVRNEEAEHGDDLARVLASWSLVTWTVDRPRAQAATGAQRRAAVEGVWGNQTRIMPWPGFPMGLS